MSGLAKGNSGDLIRYHLTRATIISSLLVADPLCFEAKKILYVLFMW